MIRWIRQWNPSLVMLPRVELERFEEVLWVGVSLGTSGIAPVFMVGAEILWLRPRPFVLSFGDREFVWRKPRG